MEHNLIENFVYPPIRQNRRIFCWIHSCDVSALLTSYWGYVWLFATEFGWCTSAFFQRYSLCAPKPTILRLLVSPRNFASMWWWCIVCIYTPLGSYIYTMNDGPLIQPYILHSCLGNLNSIRTDTLGWKSQFHLCRWFEKRMEIKAHRFFWIAGLRLDTNIWEHVETAKCFFFFQRVENGFWLHFVKKIFFLRSGHS